ncbi:MAG TPA: methionine--tRNA ligase subunit beta, partial [Bacteroidales bacterium]
EMALYPEKISSSIEKYRFREALSELMNLARLGNKYLTDQEPWKKFKTDENTVKNILNVSLQIAANLSILSEPFLPFSSNKLQKLLNISDLKWKDAGRADLLKPGHQLNKAELLFDRIEDKEIEAQVQKLLNTKMENENSSPAKPSKGEIEFDDFVKTDIRTGTILEAEKVPKTKKLLKLKIDTGIDKRTVVSGIAEYYEPENIIGKKVCVLVNLAPRQLKGIMSQGMILMAEDKDGKLVFVSPTDEVSNGSEVK